MWHIKVCLLSSEGVNLSLRVKNHIPLTEIKWYALYICTCSSTTLVLFCIHLVYYTNFCTDDSNKLWYFLFLTGNIILYVILGQL